MRAHEVTARRVDGGGLIAAAGLTIACTVVAWIRWANYWGGNFDLTVFDQSAYLMSRGRAPDVSLLGRNLFSDHLSPVMALFAVPYRVAPTVFWLFLAQGICLGLTVLPMRALARDFDVDDRLATLLVVLSAPLAAAAMFEFHPATLAVPFIAWALLGACRGDVRLTLLASIAVLLCRADLGWVLVAIAIVGRPNTRRLLVGLGLAGLAAGSLLPALIGGPGSWTAHYGHLGTSPSDFALHPWRLFTKAFGRDPVTTLFTWLLPVGFLTVLRPRWLFAVVVAGLPVLLSRWPGTQLPWFHYGAPFVPLVIGGALAALQAPASGGAPPPIYRSAAVAIGGVVVGALLVGPLSPRAPGPLELRTVLHTDDAVDYASAVRNVRASDAVAVTGNALGHLAHRDRAFLFPQPFEVAVGVPAPGLEADASPIDAADIDIVIVLPADEAKARALGFTQQIPVRGLYVARR